MLSTQRKLAKSRRKLKQPSTMASVKTLRHTY